MRVAGHNLLAITAAAVAMYLIEFVMYGMAIPPATYMALSHMTAEEGAANGWKMPFGIIGPLIWATGLSIAIGWKGAKGAQAGAMVGAVTAVFFMCAARFYQWGYGPTGLDFYAVDAFHFLLCGAVGGAIIAAWPASKTAA
ncbi:MAG: DUF1761 family protein [Hyphomonadaceae bacterium]|nr:DUF1761 family protein [Hyphomonadaceae bacterium]